LLKVATAILAAMNLYSSLESCIGNEPQGGAIGHYPPGWRGVRLCRIVNMNFGEFTFHALR
jgi:hypothetical protein